MFTLCRLCRERRSGYRAAALVRKAAHRVREPRRECPNDFREAFIIQQADTAEEDWLARIHLPRIFGRPDIFEHNDARQSCRFGGEERLYRVETQTVSPLRLVVRRRGRSWRGRSSRRRPDSDLLFCSQRHGRGMKGRVSAT
jgi:hypothetical protein